ncbi:TPR domain containing [Chlorella sorokiniana]|uniref:TPR domain containing n=1 Tax=Chlorella sorokiniana TaxID=3076 RepID=A0A2P6U3T4_CHLSO|nr:TPR domain containing [Chlorella sorokiniana]|eukprot:PRW60974.1 TPR domain containing [Chlorella sorokiniana]
MADEAGPSGAGTGKVAPEALQEAERKFERGIQCIRTNDLEQAVQLFAEVLQVRTEHFGELAPECASAYYRYGAALLYQAQDSADVFGAGVREAADDDPAASEADDKENGGDKGKAPAASAGGEGEEEEEEGEESGAEGDLQLAWENLETAKVIWAKDADRHAQQLADVHGLLGDVAMESDDFGTALAELDASLAYLAKFVQDDDRRIAEVQYKRCCALQFSGELTQALPAVQAALDCLGKRRAALLARIAAPAEGDDPEKLRAESEEVAALQDDLKEKVTELEDLIKQDVNEKNMIKGVFAQAMGALGGGQQQQAAAAAPQQAAAPAQDGAEGGFDSASGGGAAVKNLGVVGRGTKRIKLQPVQTNVPAAAPEAGACAASAGEPAAKKKRSLEDLMGGGGEDGETTIGFGAAPAAPAAKPAEKAAPPAAAASALPAFLQPGNVQAVYGSAEKAQQ